MVGGDAPAGRPDPTAKARGDKQPSLLTGLREVYAKMSGRRRRQFYLVIVFMLLGTAAELATIGAVIPFVALLANPDSVNQLPWLMTGLERLGADTGSERLVGATLVFSILALVTGMVRLQHSWLMHKFIFELAHEFSVEVQRRILFQPYAFHIRHNTGSLSSSVDKVDATILQVVRPLIQTFSASFMAAFIIFVMIYIDVFSASTAIISFLAIYFVVSRFARPRLALNSAVVIDNWNAQIRILQESLGAIRNVIVDNLYAVYLRQFSQINARLSSARVNTEFIASSPRFVVETFGMLVIALIALISAQRDGLTGSLPMLGALALAAQRLLPLLQQIYSGWSLASGNRAVFSEVLDLLRLPVGPEHAVRPTLPQLPLNDKISIKDVSFAFPARRVPAVRDITLEIPRGSSVAIIGETGSGKSTIVDLLMGLLEPDKGTISIDNVPLTALNRGRWHSSIAHVPQSIFLADASIAYNIALSIHGDALDLERIAEAASIAQLDEFIMSLPEGYATQVGERGIRLSGGQRQRLGLARAIYKDAPVLVLDEATSALDEDTEAAVMDALHKLGEEGRTIVIIAHRTSTISRCDIVARLHNGRLAELGTFAQVVGARQGTTPRRGGRGSSSR